MGKIIDENDAIEAARIVSDALKNRRGEYWPVVVGAVVNGIRHAFKNGEPYGEPIPKKGHRVYGPPSPLVEENDFEEVRIPEEWFKLEDELLQSKLQNQK